MSDQRAEADQSRITVTVPTKLHMHLKRLAMDKQVSFKDYLQEVLDREARRHPESHRVYSN